MAFHAVKRTRGRLSKDGRKVRIAIDSDAGEFGAEMPPDTAAEMISVICEASGAWKGPVPRLRPDEPVSQLVPKSAQWRSADDKKQIELVLWFGRLRLAVTLKRADIDALLLRYSLLESGPAKRITFH